MMSTISSQKKTLGLSLVELMVAITISLILLLGVTSVYLSTRHSNAVQDEFSRLQENGRFAISLLSKEIRQAGYQGCSNLGRVTPVNNVSTGGNKGPVDTSFNFSSSTAFVGHTACTGGTGAGCTPATTIGSLPVITGTEAITVRRTSSCASELTGNLNVRNANLQTTDNSCNFQKNEVLFITDCKNGDIFRATSVSAASGKITIAHGSNGNNTAFLSQRYTPDARVMKWERHTYYIAPCASNVTGCRSLWVNVDQGNTNLSTELVEHIDNMQVDYRVDTALTDSADPSVDAFMTGAQVQAGNLWPNVLAVRIHLLAATRDNTANQNNGKNQTPYTFEGITNNSTDRRYRREFTTTINLRNRTL